MDEQLAQIYGTNQSNDAEDLEKTAAAELLVKLAEEQGVDLREFSDEEIAQLVQELYSEKTAEEKDEKKEPPKEEKKEEKKEEEAKEKAAEADFLGRVMAHAYVQELNQIEKEAGVKEKYEAAKGAVAGGGKKGKELLERFGARYKPSVAAGKEAVKGERPGGRSGSTLFLTKKERAGAALEALKKAPGEVKAVGAAGLGAAAYEAGKHQDEKRAEDESALKTLIEKRAYDILAGNGWVNEQGEVLAPPQAEQPEQAKEASVLEQAVEVEALKLLEANGYPVEWNQ